MTVSQSELAMIPSVDRVLTEPAVQAMAEQCNLSLIKDLLRSALDTVREALVKGNVEAFDREVLIDITIVELRRLLENLLSSNLKRVVNATGIILHTNLGRAPLPKEAIDQIRETAGGYNNLELDLESGRRGSRTTIVEEVLCLLTGAEAAAVVNNNAAAVLITLNTLALDREVIVSRGQLIEIGDSFRIPDIMTRSGVRMVEVGTTNRTHLEDVEQAISARTGLLMAIHPSNFQVLGFASDVPLSELVALGHRQGLPVAHDLGGGVLIDLREYGLPYEPVVSESVSAGADVVCFSGDKILGGPQAGILVGNKDVIEQIRRNPLMRAVRCGKLTYAALEATLKLYLDRKRLIRTLPTLRMLTESPAILRRRGKRLLDLLKHLGGIGWDLRLQDSVAQGGSGSLPLEKIPSIALTLKGPAGCSIAGLATRLRQHSPPVLGYVREDRVWLDLRSTRSNEVGIVADAIKWAVEGHEEGSAKNHQCRAEEV